MNLKEFKGEANEFQRLLNQLINRMSQIDQTDLKFVGFHNWLEENHYGRGLKRGSIYNVRKFLTGLINDLESGSQKPGIHLLRQTEVKRAVEFIDAAKIYLEEIVKDEFSGRTFLLYCLYYGVNHSGEPKLSRIILRTGTNNEVEVENLSVDDDHYSEDYKGTYEFMTSNIVRFDLKNKSDNQTLHMKVSFNKADDQVMLGTYSTYNRARIFTGTIVLEQVSKATIVLNNIQPKLLSMKDSPQELLKVDVSIRKYLSLKSQNFYLLPKPRPTFKALSDFLDEYPLFPDLEGRFLEIDKPTVFFACSKRTGDLSVSEDEEGKLLNSLIKTVSEDCKKKGLKWVYRTLDPESDVPLTSEEGFGIIRRSRYFILFVNDVGPASFSHVQLGFALATVKNILVVYRHKSVSERFKELEIFGAKRKRFDRLDQEACDEIISSIGGFIEKASLT